MQHAASLKLSRIRNSNIALLYILSILSTRFTKPLLILRKTCYDHRPQRDSSKCSSNWRSIMTELNNKLRHFKTFFCPFFPAQVSRPAPEAPSPGQRRLRGPIPPPPARPGGSMPPIRPYLRRQPEARGPRGRRLAAGRC